MFQLRLAVGWAQPEHVFNVVVFMWPERACGEYVKVDPVRDRGRYVGACLQLAECDCLRSLDFGVWGEENSPAPRVV